MTKERSRDIDAFLRELRRVHREYPDLRIGQIVVNSLHASCGNDAFYVENEELVRGMRERLPRVMAHRAGKR